jgi:hypothetical protein
MNPAIIQLTYRQILDHTTTDPFQQAVLALTYDEFKLKSQAYNPDGVLRTFTQLKAADGRANSLHYKCYFPITNLIGNLQGKMPIIHTLDNRPLPFTTCRLELIESNLDDPKQHQVALLYFTPSLILLDSIGNALLLTYPVQKSQEGSSEPELFKDTFLVGIQPFVSISNYQSVSGPDASS